MTDPLSSIIAQAKVPEHSLPLMEAISRGKPMLLDSWLFFSQDDWLMAIGYPLRGKFDANSFDAALRKAREQTSATRIFAIGPDMPARLRAKIVERDRYYALPVHAQIPSRLKNQAAKAALSLTVSESDQFTAPHRRLWAEFLERKENAMSPRVAALYAATPAAMASGRLKLLDARDADGNICAALLLDYNPQNFVSYILGAHSRYHYAAHAMDLLFYEMLRNAAKTGKKYVHLGLGVNPGIERFKRKWGAVPFFPYAYAQWEENDGEAVSLALARALMGSGVSARQYMNSQPENRHFAMLWRVEKNNRVSWLGGTAHFFCHSFETSFRKLFRNVDNVIFEGPLDADFMGEVEQSGKTPEPGATPILDLLDKSEIEALERIILPPRNDMLAPRPKAAIDVRNLLAHARPWYALFTMWTTFLESRGWRQSVDMEAWRIAGDMGKNIIAMETLEEQLESLNSLPMRRVLNFFRSCSSWKSQSNQNMRAYLNGDLEKMMGSSAEFPTRTEYVIGRRDQRFRERMRPWLEEGRTAVFVGSAHLVNLRHMLVEDGFQVRQAPFGIWPKIHLQWRKLTRPDEKVSWRLPSA